LRFAPAAGEKYVGKRSGDKATYSGISDGAG
jgi:hypothetical protein